MSKQKAHDPYSVFVHGDRCYVIFPASSPQMNPNLSIKHWKQNRGGLTKSYIFRAVCVKKKKDSLRLMQIMLIVPAPGLMGNRSDVQQSIGLILASHSIPKQNNPWIHSAKQHNSCLNSGFNLELMYAGLGLSPFLISTCRDMGSEKQNFIYP